jgi:hypothetical protein
MVKSTGRIRETRNGGDGLLKDCVTLSGVAGFIRLRIYFVNAIK